MATMSSASINADFVRLDIHDVTGNAIPEDAPELETVQKIIARMHFDADDFDDATPPQNKIDRLQRKLERHFLSSSGSLETAASGMGQEFVIEGILAPEKAQLQFAADPSLPQGWFREHGDSASIDALTRELERIIASHAPLTAKNWQKIQKDLVRFSLKNHSWMVVRAQLSVADDGNTHVVCFIAPVPKGFSANIDGHDVTAADVILDSPLPEKIGMRELATEGANYFTALSESYAAQDRVLSVVRDGSTVPYLPEFDRDAAVWRLTASTENGTALPIESLAAPHFLAFTLPVDAHGTAAAPEDWEAQSRFRDTQGRLTTASIYAGLIWLTDWYNDRGYALVGGHIAARFDGETLRVTADLYRLAADIAVTPPGIPDDADKQAIAARNAAREFRCHAGEFFNAHELGDALSAINAKFPYQAIPDIDFDETSGTAQVTVTLDDKHMKRVEKLSLAGGYAGGSGLFGGAEAALRTTSGIREAAAVTLYPGANLASSNVSVATPRDTIGGEHHVSLWGSYYLDYLSGVGVSESYSLPLGDSDFSLILGGGVKALFSEDQAIPGTDAVYFSPNIGIAYAKNGFSASLIGGPRINTQGAIYAGVAAEAAKRWDLNTEGTWYATVYAKAGVLFGGVPEADMYHAAPFVLHGYVAQPPLAVKIYAMVGADVMREIPGGAVDIGLGASAGIIGGVLVVGGGVKIRLKVIFPMTVTVGPALVDGIPTPITVSLGG